MSIGDELTLAMVVVTGLLAIFTGWMAWETRANRMEAERREKRIIFQVVLTSLLWKIQSCDRWYQCVSSGIPYEKEAADSFPVYGGLDRLPLPSSALRRSLGIVAYVRRIEADVARKERWWLPDDEEAQAKAREEKLHLLRLVRFYLRQFGCYLVTEVRRQGFNDLADAIEGTKLLEPTADMVALKGGLPPETACRAIQSQFWPLPPEPDNPEYEQCRCQRLLEKAEARNREEGQVLAKTHSH
jgi:hypothetical protein